MATLPTPGADFGNWGTDLNNYMLVGHDSAGHHSQWWNVKEQGAAGDGATDDTTAIQAAINAANSAGGGVVFFPAGTYLTGSLTLFSFVHLIGAGIGATTLKLKSSTNADLLWGGSTNAGFINLSGSFGTGNVGGLVNFSVQSMTLDGNKAGQASGPSYPLRVYGYGYILHNLRVKNGYSGGILSDWNGGSNSPGNDSMECQWTNVKVHDCNGIGVEFGGPHDSQMVNVVVYTNGTTNMHFCPNCVGTQLTSAHMWMPGSGVHAPSLLIEGFIICDNVVSEGSDTAQVAILDDNTVYRGGRVFGNNPPNSVFGIQIGQAAGQTPFAGSLLQSAGVTTAKAPAHCFIDTTFRHTESGAVNFANTGGHNVVKGHASYVTAGAAAFAGTSDVTDLLQLSQDGVTPDGTFGKGGRFRTALNANNAFVVTDTANDIVNVNTNGKKLEMVNGTRATWYSDAYSTTKASINADGNGSIITTGGISGGQSASAPAVATSGTISTAALTVSRVAPSGAVTGVILQAGTVAGQICVVVNESAAANTVTMAAAGTSNVADGTSCVIAGLTQKTFVWDSSTSRWYHN